MADSKTIAGIDYALMEHFKTLEQYKDSLAILPDKHRILMKTLGPLYTAYMKMNMGLESVKQTAQKLTPQIDEMGEETEKSGKKMAKGMLAVAAPVTILAKVFSPLMKVVGGVAGMMKGMVVTMLPMIGTIFAVMMAVMVLVAALDKGGGSLGKWLSDLPIIGGLFDFVKTTIDKMKEAFGGVSISGDQIMGTLEAIATKVGEIFGPALSALVEGAIGFFTGFKDNVLALWDSMKANITLDTAQFEEVFAFIQENLVVLVEAIIGAYSTVSEMIFAGITAIMEAGLVQAWIDAFMGMVDAFMGGWEMIGAALGDGAIEGFFTFVMDLWTGLLDFLVTSGIFAFLGDVFAFVSELAQTVIFLVALVISLVIKLVKFIYPYVKPYYSMLIGALGFVMTYVIGVVRTVMKVISALLAVLRGDFGRAKEIIMSIGDVWRDVFSGMSKFFKQIVNGLLGFISPVFKLINAAISTFNKIPLVPNLPLINVGAMKLAKGGVVTGPKSGYPAELHGTEAVVPLPDGRTIPVTIQNAGALGGGETTININVSGANGDARQIARMVGDEVGRLFKSRSRGSGFSRGL